MHESVGMQELLEQFHENKLSHAFLLETNNEEMCLKNLLEFLAYINRTGEAAEDEKLFKLITTENLPSVIIIRPDGINIKKEQILELKRSFQTKPVFSKYNMYIILSAEQLNTSSANTMLKFLEEPEENILGFFITNNRENVIATIKSRCQIVMDQYEISDFLQIPKIWQQIAINFVKEYEIVHEETILYNKNVVLPLIHDKKESFYFFQSIFLIYESLFLCQIGSQELPLEYQSLKFLLKKEKNYFLTQLEYISKLLDEMNYNLNIGFLLDRFVLESR